MSTRKGDTKEKSTKPTAAKKVAAAKPAPAAAVKPVAKAAGKAVAKAAPVKAAAKSAAPKPAAPKPPLAKAAPVKAAAKSAAPKPAAAKSAAPKPAVKAPARPALAAVPQRETPSGRDGTAPGHTPRLPALTQKDLKRFEELLLGERQRLLRELGHLEKNVLKRSLRETSGELSGYSFHMADVGTDAMEREKAFHFASAEGRALLDVDDALRRLYGGEYGHCESCGNPVSPERLEVVPHARLCIDCKQKEERAQIGRSR